MDDIHIKAQQNEINEYHIYHNLAKKCTNKKNIKILKEIADEEKTHYERIKKVTKKEIKPQMLKVWWYTFLAGVLGLSFALKLMENGEAYALEMYKTSKSPVLTKLWVEEHKHEKHIIGLLEDERVEYAGSIVLGLNDALVELTGALAGLTLALRDTKVIAVIGMITGFAASLSMAASEFLSAREGHDKGKNPVKSSIYTGIAYIVVVTILVLPYLLLTNHWAALGIMLALNVLIIAGYTYYMSVAKEIGFSKRFFQMAAISIGVAIISFFVGILLRSIFGIDA